MVQSFKFLRCDCWPPRGVGSEKASSLFFLSDLLCFSAGLPIGSCLAVQDGVGRDGRPGGWGHKLRACGWRLVIVAYCVASSGISKSTSAAGHVFDRGGGTVM